MPTLTRGEARSRLPLPAEIVDTADLITAFATREHQDSLDELPLAEALHTAVGHRPDVDDAVSFEALPHVRQQEYLKAAAVALRRLSPAWVAMATQIAVAETDPHTVIRTFLYVLEGLKPLTNGQRVELMRMVSADAPWHYVELQGAGHSFYVGPCCWTTWQARQDYTDQGRSTRGTADLEIRRVAPDKLPYGATCHVCDRGSEVG